MDNEKQDFTEGKSWFTIMWSNKYIQLFAIAIIALTYIIIKRNEIFDYSGATGLILILIIPVGMMILIGYFAFYKFWNDLKNGKSR